VAWSKGGRCSAGYGYVPVDEGRKQKRFIGHNALKSSKTKLYIEIGF